MLHKINQKYQKKIFGIPTSDKEIKDILKAWVAISFAFTILLNGLKFDSSTLMTFLLSAFTVGIGFLFHELGHKIVAQMYGHWAEFRAFDTMLMMAIVFSFFGFILAAPGAVMIRGYHITMKENGVISLAGPLVNFVLALVFLVVMLSPVKMISMIAQYGFMINTWLGVFNLIPLLNFDGKKILKWNPVVYGVMVAFGFSLLVLQYII